MYSDIPVLSQGQVPACGKPGKALRILDSKICENEEALLNMLEESWELSDSDSSSDSDLEDLVELKRKHKQSEKVNKKMAKKLQKHLLKLKKTKLLEERAR